MKTLSINSAKTVIFIILCCIISASWAQETQFQYANPDHVKTVLSAYDQDTLFQFDNHLFHKQHRPDASDPNKIVAETNKSYIVQFKGNPLLKEKPSSAGYKSTIAAKEDIFRQFQADLDKIAPKQTKSSGQAVIKPEIQRQFIKTFYGASFTMSSSMLQEVRKLAYVKYVSENKVVKAIPIQESGTTGYAATKLNGENKGDSIRVGIIDTGIDYTHSALGGGLGADFKVKGGYDFINSDHDPMDDHGHGTHVAGIVAGDNDIITGVAPNVFLYGYKALDENGSGWQDDIIAAIELCVDPNNDGNFEDRMDVVNLSLGSANGKPSDPDAIAVNNATDAGIVFSISAGNEGEKGSQTIGSPGTATKAITVGAYDANGKMAFFSSTGPNKEFYNIKPEISAPGVDIYSSVLDGEYEEHSGTSMAAPYITGVCALIRRAHPDWTPADIKSAIMSTAQNLDLHVMQQGAGLVDPKKTYEVSTLTYPASLNFGLVNDTSGNYSETRSIRICNKHTANQQYTLNWSTDFPDIEISLSNDTIEIAPGDTAVVEVSLTANEELPFTKEKHLSYFGKLNIESNLDSLNVFWTVLKARTLTIQPQGFSVIIILGDDKSHSLNLTAEDITFFVPDTSYTAFCQTLTGGDINENYFIIRQTELLSADTIVLDLELCKNTVHFQLRDENNEKLDDDQLDLVWVTLRMPSWIWETNLPSSLRFADYFPDSAIKIEMSGIDHAGNNYYSSEVYLDDIQTDTTISNKPEEYIKFPIRINMPYYSELEILTTYVHPKSLITFSNTFGNLAIKQWPWTGTFYLNDNKGITHFSTFALGLAKPEEDSLFKSLRAPNIFLKAEQDSLYNFSTEVWRERYAYFDRFKSENTLLHPAEDTVFYCMNNLNIMSKFEYHEDRSDSLFIKYNITSRPGASQFLSYRDNETFSIFNSEGVDMSPDSLNSDFIGSFLKLPEDTYTFTYNYEGDISFGNQKTKNTLTQKVNTALEDRFPANITTLIIRNSKGQNNPWLHANEASTLQFAAVDYLYKDSTYYRESRGEDYTHYYNAPKQVDSITVLIRNNSEEQWTVVSYDELPSDVYSGRRGSVDLAEYTANGEAFYDVKIEVIDSAGNTTTAQYIPCFGVSNRGNISAENDYYTTPKGVPLTILPENSILSNDHSGINLSPKLYYNLMPFNKFGGKLTIQNFDSATFYFEPWFWFEGIDSAKYYIWNDLFESDSAYLIIQIGDITSNLDKTVQQHINVYPVPATDLLNIQVPEEYGAVQYIRILDLNGRVFRMYTGSEQNSGSSYITLHLNESGKHMVSGIYLLEVLTSKNRFTKKISVQ